jgi:hypothetical protein
MINKYKLNDQVKVHIWTHCANGKVVNITNNIVRVEAEGISSDYYDFQLDEVQHNYQQMLELGATKDI